MSVSLGDATYPDEEEILALLQARVGRLVVVDALPLAEQAGNARTVNTIMLAAFSSLLKTDPDVWETAMLRRVPETYREVNKVAFRLGYGAAAES
jgi:indolepyruvate ferredoxin oxidoreductase beta subunit